jgi:preprotein translocase subunit SecD
MLEFPRWKVIWLWLITLVIAAAALPSLVDVAGYRWPAGLPEPKVNLGLDLAGGSDILLEADPAQVRTQRIEGMEESVRNKLHLMAQPVRISDISNNNGTLTFLVDDPGKIDAVREAVLPLTNGAGLTGKRDWTITVADGNRFVLTPTQEGIDLAVTQAMDTAVEVVRKRIDALGTKEPTIVRSGTNRIVVEVPGLQDPQALKSLLGQTAKLEFKLVDQSAGPSDVAQGIAPPGDEIVPYATVKPGMPAPKIAVHRLGGIRGDELTNAQLSNDPQTNSPTVSITFNTEGGEKFAKLTSANVGKPFAIILDGKVIEAPNINTPILGGSAVIQGGFTTDSANELAISLRSGALPVDLKVVEERTVGPDLGADSIRKGMIAMAVGTLALAVFIVVTYGRFGVYACCSLVLNLFMILGTMGIIGTTLTLPGIAGFVLTIGAAVDAQVLIFERIREERHRGRRVVQAVEIGYREATRAILDANITNIIAATLMFAFGSGPVKGFAVVLMIGILTSVFTAVTMTRMWVAQWLRRARPAEINI